MKRQRTAPRPLLSFVTAPDADADASALDAARRLPADDAPRLLGRRPSRDGRQRGRGVGRRQARRRSAAEGGRRREKRRRSTGRAMDPVHRLELSEESPEAIASDDSAAARRESNDDAEDGRGADPVQVQATQGRSSAVLRCRDQREVTLMLTDEILRWTTTGYPRRRRRAASRARSPTCTSPLSNWLLRGMDPQVRDDDDAATTTPRSNAKGEPAATGMERERARAGGDRRAARGGMGEQMATSGRGGATSGERATGSASTSSGGQMIVVRRVEEASVSTQTSVSLAAARRVPRSPPKPQASAREELEAEVSAPAAGRGAAEGAGRGKGGSGSGAGRPDWQHPGRRATIPSTPPPVRGNQPRVAAAATGGGRRRDRAGRRRRRRRRRAGRRRRLHRGRRRASR